MQVFNASAGTQKTLIKLTLLSPTYLAWAVAFTLWSMANISLIRQLPSAPTTVNNQQLESIPPESTFTFATT